MARSWSASDYDFQVIDPQHLPFNKIPPPVKVERLIVDGNDVLSFSQGLKLPVHTRQIRTRLCCSELRDPGTGAFSLPSGWP